MASEGETSTLSRFRRQSEAQNLSRMRTSKVDPEAHAQRLLNFFTAHRFTGVENARCVFAQGPSDLWVTEDDERLAGALLGVGKRCLDGDLRGCAENCLVDPAYRRRGVARELLEVAEAYYRARALVGMEFAVRKDFEPNQSLLGAGYEIIREYRKNKRDRDGNLIIDQERYIIRKDFHR